MGMRGCGMGSYNGGGGGMGGLGSYYGGGMMGIRGYLTCIPDPSYF